MQVEGYQVALVCKTLHELALILNKPPEIRSVLDIASVSNYILPRLLKQEKLGDSRKP